MAKYIQVQTFKFMSQTLLLLLAKTLETLYCGTSLETNDTSFNTFVSHIKPNLKKNIGMPRYATLKKKTVPTHWAIFGSNIQSSSLFEANRISGYNVNCNTGKVKSLQ